MCGKFYIAISIISLILCAIQVDAQRNLIADYSFEDSTSCPYPDFEKHPTWSGSSTPDIYNKCGKYYPVNLYGNFQQARSGNGYAGIYLFFPSLSQVEYLETKLLHKLQKDKQYYVRYYVNATCNVYKGYCAYIKKIGLAFSETNEFDKNSEGYYTDLAPVLENNGEYISDTANWTKISGCYTANGSEEYIVIGNLGLNNKEIKIDGNVSPSVADVYVNIDDVGVYEVNPIVEDTLTICDSKSISLNAAFLDATYEWSTGDVDSSIIVRTPGRYSVQISIDGCVFYDTVMVVDIDRISVSDTVGVCDNQYPVYINAPVTGSYLWSDGSVDRVLEVSTGDEYYVDVENICGTRRFDFLVTDKKCDCKPIVPSAFSPNGDGLNDVFRILTNTSCDLEYHIQSFSVYNRWGQQVFISREETAYWDGKYKGFMQDVGTYFWVLNYSTSKNGQKDQHVLNGDVILIR